MSEAMAAEFDTVAEWTAEAALALGPETYLPAGCRGSGSPVVLKELVRRLQIGPTDRMLDCGAGVGGPAAFAAREVGVRPVLTDPESGACRAAARLFDLPALQAASQLPFGSGTFDVAWCLGVLCTVQDQPLLLAELRRVLTPNGRLGLLVFVAETTPLSEQPEGNNFPTEAGLRELLRGAGLQVKVTDEADLGEVPEHWQERADAVEAELERRHGDDPVWTTAAEQSAIIGRLLSSGELRASVLVTEPA